MKKNDFLKLINPVLAAAFLYQIITAMLHDLIPGKIFESVHVGGGIFLTLCVILHLLLNWSWVKVNFLSNGGKKTRENIRPS